MKRHRLNVVGPFYVVDLCCTQCGVPQQFAPMLFGEDDVSCFVKRQPETADEMRAMVETMARQELGCIRYGGPDKAIIGRLEERGEGDQCDRPSLLSVFVSKLRR